MLKLRVQIHLSLEFTAKRLQGKLGEAPRPMFGSCARPIEQAGGLRARQSWAFPREPTNEATANAMEGVSLILV